MKLKKWLKINKVSYRQFGELIGIDHSAIYRYAASERTPTLPIAILIEEATEGKVTVRDLLCQKRKKKSPTS